MSMYVSSVVWSMNSTSRSWAMSIGSGGPLGADAFHNPQCLRIFSITSFWGGSNWTLPWRRVGGGTGRRLSPNRAASARLPGRRVSLHVASNSKHAPRIRSLSGSQVTRCTLKARSSSTRSYCRLWRSAPPTIIPNAYAAIAASNADANPRPPSSIPKARPCSIYLSDVSDLGSQGDTPSHPRLFDWLAVELMDHDWSLPSALGQAFRERGIESDQGFDSRGIIRVGEGIGGGPASFR